MPTATDTLLRYRPWRGVPLGPSAATLAIARVSLLLLLRRRLFWGLFALAGLVFFFFFYGQYLVTWIPSQFAGGTVRIAAIPVSVEALTKFLDRLALTGTNPHLFGNFVWFEGYVLVIALALAGSVIVGNDFAHGSLPFYLSKPIGRWHYVAGKCLAIGAVVNLLTTLPALVLFVEAGLLLDWTTYFVDYFDLLLGILGYGLVLSVTLSLLLMATAVWLRKTVPLAMVWMGLFVFLRLMAGWLVDGLKADERWRLLDLWNDLYLCGLWCLGAEYDTIRPQPQPSFGEAALVVAGVCGACWLYLRRRIQAVEVVA